MNASGDLTPVGSAGEDVVITIITVRENIPSTIVVISIRARRFKTTKNGSPVGIVDTAEVVVDAAIRANLPRVAGAIRLRRS